MAGRASDPTARFFEGLAAHGYEPLLRKVSDSFRFDIADGRRTRSWILTVDEGNLDVARGKGEATCVLRAEKAVFDKLASGRMNAVAAVLRGDLVVEGEWRMLVRLQRLFPGPRRRRGTA